MGGQLTACKGKKPPCAACACGDEHMTKKPRPMLERYPSKRKRKDIKNLQDEVDQKKAALDEIKSSALDLSPRLSQHDAELVADEIRDLERRYGELESGIRRKREGYSSLGSDINAIKEEADNYLSWLDQQQVDTERDKKLGHSVENVEKRLEAVKDLETELSQRQLTLDSVGQKSQALVADLPSQEKDNLENLLASVQSKHNELYGAVSDQCRALEEKLDQRKEFREHLEKLNKWLDERENAADPFSTIRLLAVHVEKQIDKCKSLGAKVQNQAERINELASKAETLEEECDEEEEQKLNALVQDVRQKHEKLLQKVKDQQNNLRDCCSSRKSFEGDCQKIERWCKDTEMQIQTELPPDCAVEVLEEQHKVYKSLENSVQVFSSLVSETKEKGNNFFPTLLEADKPQLQKQLDGLDSRFQEVNANVEDRIKNLEDMVDSRSQTRNQVENTEQWLREVQEELKQSNTPIGHTCQDAELVLRVFESIGEKLESYQPSMNELENMGGRLKAENQASQAEDINRLSALYNSLLEQVRQHTESVNMAIGARRSYEQMMSTQEELVKEQDEVVNNIMNCGLPLEERITTLKNVIECLQNQDSDLNVAKDKARQIGKQGSEDDFSTVVGQVDSVKDKVKDLKSQAQGLISKCENIQKGRHDFESAVLDMVSWFEEKEDVLATCQSLQVDANSVEPTIEKHKATSVEAVDKMQAIKNRMTLEASAFEDMQEAPTPEFAEKMEQIQALESTLLSAINKKEQYLTEAQADRKQYDNSMKQVSEWLRGAETLLDSGYEGLDFDTLESTLNDFTDYFSEASLCQDEIEQVVELSDRLLPTLDDNDSATLKQSLNNVNRKFINVSGGSQTKQAMMEHKVEQWKEFQKYLEDMNSKLDVMESEWAEVEKNSDTSPDAVMAHLEMVKGFLAHVETSRPQIDNLNELARELDRVANPPSRDVINQRINALNQRWDTLIGETENRVLSLETIGGQWGDFATMLSSLQTIVHDSENKFRIINLDVATHEELKSELNNLKDIGENLERVEPQLTRLQSSRLSLQQALPTAEAKISSQEQFIELVGAYERLNQTVQSETEKAQEEYEERHTFLSEIDRSIAWFQDTLENIHSYQPGGLDEDMSEKLNKHKAQHNEVENEIDSKKALEKAQEARYAALGKEIPVEMADKMKKLHALQEQVLAALKEKEEDLLHIKEDREEYKATFEKVILWLQKADMQLQENIINIPEAQQNHQALLLEFDDFKPNLDHLRNKGGDIIRHSSDPHEKQTIQKNLADVNRQWLSLQAQSADKTQELSEASDLSNAIDDVANSVTSWAEHVQDVLGEDLQLTNFDKLKEQLKSYRKLRREVDPNQDKVIALNAMVKQLEQVCSSPANMTKVGELKQQVNAIDLKSDVQLSALEEANKRMEEFEREVGDLMNWLEQTRAKMTMRDTTRDLKDQLAVQERVVRYTLESCGRQVEIVDINL